MNQFTHIADVQLLDPTRVAVKLARSDDLVVTNPIVMSPNDFITDFSTFLTAMRAEAETRPVNCRTLRQSWRHFRDVVRKRLVEDDPWGQRDEAAETVDSNAASQWARQLCGLEPEESGRH